MSLKKAIEHVSRIRSYFGLRFILGTNLYNQMSKKCLSFFFLQYFNTVGKKCIILCVSDKCPHYLHNSEVRNALCFERHECLEADRGCFCLTYAWYMCVASYTGLGQLELLVDYALNGLRDWQPALQLVRESFARHFRA